MERTIKMYRQLLKSCVSHSEKMDLNKVAPEGTRWCNFLCQDYVDIDKFYADPNRVSGLCMECERKNLLCRKYVKCGRMTVEEFRNDPGLLEILKDKVRKQDATSEITLQCTRCNEIKAKDSFDVNRVVCKGCRQKEATERTEQDYEYHIKVVEDIKDDTAELEKYLKTVPVNVICRILKHYGMGRSSNHKKADHIIKLVEHFRHTQNPFMCLGNCGFALQEKFSTCEKCKDAPRKSRDEANLAFKEGLDEFMSTLIEIPDDDQYTYNIYCIHAMAEFLGIKVTKGRGSTKMDFIKKINAALVEKRSKERSVALPETVPLELNGIAVVTREDGFVNATQLCKAGGKLFGDWKRLDSTTALMEELASDTQIPISALMDITKGGNDKKAQGSWIHPDLAVQLAQWISPVFAIKVSRYIRELAITGSVNLEQNRTDVQVRELQTQLKVTEEKRQRRLRQRNYHKFKKGPCFYIVSDIDSMSKRYKVGYDHEDMNVRLKAYRTSIPGARLEFLVYTENDKLLETNMLQRYESLRKYSNHEWIYDIELEHLLDSVSTFITLLGLEVTIEDELDRYNMQVVLGDVDDV